ncbi:MAG: hypothetical protein GXO09_00940 [Crenarchaeota archaeon]|nr:hypothetical protein [Thermoproteota archaeon]
MGSIPQRTWRHLPLYYRVLEVVEAKGGRCRLDEVLNELRKEDAAITLPEVLKAVMKLEMQGIIGVNIQGEDKLELELLQNP